MSDFKNDLEKAVDRAVFKTDDPDRVRQGFVSALEAWSKETSSLGGFLKDIRLLRYLSTDQCALKVGVSRRCWQSWEADRETPSPEEIEGICRGMGFGSEKRARLLELRALAPKQRLLMISRFQRPYLAARGTAKLDADLEWNKWPLELQGALQRWGQSQGYESTEAILEFIESLKDDDARLMWTDKVLSFL